MLQRSAAIGLVIPWLTLAAVGQEATDRGPEQTSGYFETIDVNVVNVEVYVTDRKGVPIEGLTLADFELTEDGRRMEITNFYASGSPAAPGAQLAAEEQRSRQLKGAPGSTVIRQQQPEDQRLHLILFVDNLNLSPRSRNRVLEALQGSLFFNLTPEDRVMVVSYDGSINIRQGLTADPNDLVPVFEEIAAGSPRGVHNAMNRRAILSELARADQDQEIDQPGPALAPDNLESIGRGLLSTIRSYAQERFNEVTTTVSTLTGFVDALSGLPGRKALIYVSDGLELRPGEALFYAWESKFAGTPAAGVVISIEAETRNLDATPAFEKLGRHANANRVTFYTLLASGGQAQTLTPAEEGAFVDVGRPASQLGRVWNDRIEALEASSFRSSMQILADATGGQATLSATAFGRALKRLADDFSHYYSLGYASPSAGDGKDHKIRVQVKDKSHRVRHRESYRDKSADQRMSDHTMSALVFETHDNPLRVVVEIGEEIPEGKGKYRVPIVVKFPISKLLLVPRELHHEGRVSIYVGVRDAQGRTSPIRKIPAPIRVPNDQMQTALAQVAGFRATLLMREGEHEVVVGVRDELADLGSTARATHAAGSL